MMKTKNIFFSTKSMFYALCAIGGAFLMGCSEQKVDALRAQLTTLKISVEGEQTRAVGQAVGVADRYVLAVYADKDYTVPSEVFANKKSQQVSSNGTFEMLLDRTEEYYCLLWADNAASDIYDITSLKSVKLRAGRLPVEAWRGVFKIEKGSSHNLVTTLRRAVSKITLLEVGTILPSSLLKVSFNQFTQFNVADSTASNAVARVDELNFEAGVVGTATTPVQINGNDMFVLASSQNANLTNFSLVMHNSSIDETEPLVEVTNVPLRANFRTTIKGHFTAVASYSFSVSSDADWYTPDIDVEL